MKIVLQLYLCQVVAGCVPIIEKQSEINIINGQNIDNDSVMFKSTVYFSRPRSPLRQVFLNS